MATSAPVGVTFPVGTRSTIGVLTLDVLVTESTDLSAKATQYAVEQGSPISDHIIVESERLKMSGWITPTDVMAMTAVGRPKLIEAKATLRKLMTDRSELTVTTGMDTYTEMVMETCNIGRSNEADRLTVDLEFVKIRKVTLRTAAIPAAKAKDSGKGKADATKTNAGKAPNGEPAKTQRSKLKVLVSGPGEVNPRDRR
jgi:hypothetical protein